MGYSEFIFVKLADGANKSDLDWGAFAPAAGRKAENKVRPSVENVTPAPDFDYILQTWLPEGSEPKMATGETPKDPSFAARSQRFYTRENVVIGSGPRRGVRIFSMARRKPEMTSDQFIHHLTQVHGPLVKKNPSFTKYANQYIQNPVVPGTLMVTGGYKPYDNISEFWFDSIENALTAWSAPDYMEQLRADEKNFVWNPPSHRMLLDETPLV